MNTVPTSSILSSLCIRHFSFRLASVAMLGAASGGMAHAASPTGVMDVTEIEVNVGASWFGGVLDPLPYCLRVSVEGTNISAVTVQTPNGAAPQALSQTDEDWGYTSQHFSSLCAMSTDPAVGFGTFVFAITDQSGVTETATVVFAPSNPCTADPHSGYPDVTSPLHGATNVALDPTLTWQCANVPCGSFAWFMELFPTSGPGASFEADLLLPVPPMWTPGLLACDIQYMFYIASGTILPPGIQNLTTTGMDDFLYAAVFETVNQTVFTTQPTMGTRYCVGAPNSVGPGGRLCASGSAVVANQDLTLIADLCPEDTPGIFYFGPDQIQLPFGNGFRCVGGQVTRMQPVVMSGPANGNPEGVATLTADFGAPYAAGLVGGASLNFQFWYRDPTGQGGSTFNLTDALNILFQ